MEPKNLKNVNRTKTVLSHLSWSWLLTRLIPLHTNGVMAVPYLAGRHTPGQETRMVAGHIDRIAEVNGHAGSCCYCGIIL